MRSCPAENVPLTRGLIVPVPSLHPVIMGKVGRGRFTADPEDLERVEERFRELRYAVDRLEGLPRVDVYLDAGHSAWHPLNDYDAYYGEPQLQFGIVSRLVLAGIDRATGFFLNPSNYRATEDLVTYGERVAKCVALVQQDPAYVVPEIYVPNVVYDAEGRFASWKNFKNDLLFYWI